MQHVALCAYEKLHCTPLALESTVFSNALVGRKFGLSTS